MNNVFLYLSLSAMPTAASVLCTGSQQTESSLLAVDRAQQCHDAYGGRCEAPRDPVAVKVLHVALIAEFEDVDDRDQTMELVRITSWYPNCNGSHFGLSPSEIHKITGLPPQIV